MDAYFRLGRKFSIKRKKEDGSEEELNEPLIIEYVTPKHKIVQIELNNGVVEKIITIESKEAQSREIYNIDEYNFSKKSQFKKIKKNKP